jgi:hypothetical protein
LLCSIAEDGTYLSHLDSDYDPDEDCNDELSEAVSQLSEFSFDTSMMAYNSMVSSSRSHGRNTRRSSSSKREQKYSGPIKITLPYLLDKWHDALGRGRISIQVHILSGISDWKVVVARVSTNRRQVVLTFPMSSNLSRSDSAFWYVAKCQKEVMKMGEPTVRKILSLHPKSCARITASAKVKGRNMASAQDFKYEMRVNLPMEAPYKWAKPSDGDDIFHGVKFLRYPDGVVMLHIELLVDTKDNYCPEERITTMPTNITNFGGNQDGASGLLADSIAAEDDDEAARRAAKRLRDQTLEEQAEGIMDELDEVLAS